MQCVYKHFWWTHASVKSYSSRGLQENFFLQSFNLNWFFEFIVHWFITVSQRSCFLFPFYYWFQKLWFLNLQLLLKMSQVSSKLKYIESLLTTFYDMIRLFWRFCRTLMNRAFFLANQYLTFLLNKYFQDFFRSHLDFGDILYDQAYNMSSPKTGIHIVQCLLDHNWSHTRHL